MKKKLLKLLAFVLMISMFIPITANAGVTDGPATNSSTTIVKTESTTEEVPFGTDLDNYIAEKRAANQPGIGETIMESWMNLFVSENGVYKYPVYLSTVFTGVTGGNEIIVGDPNEVFDTPSSTVTYNYEVRYREVTVVEQEDPYEIKEVNATVEIPKVGDEITIEGTDWDTQRPQAPITLPSGVNYELAGSDNVNYMYYMNQGVYEPFSGKFEKGKTYTMEIWFTSKGDYYFTEDTKVVINGEEIEIDDFDEDEFSILYDFEPEAKQKEYTLTNDDNTATATFTYEDGFDFELTFIDILTLTKEQREAMDISDEVYNQALEQIKNNLKGYGTLLGVYKIEIEAPDRGYHDAVKIKVKLTDEMKKYNKFQYIYLDADNNFKVGEIVDFKIEGDYLVGTLPHLSAWALVGNKINNPQTGDNILGYVILLGISIVGLITIKKVKKEN